MEILDRKHQRNAAHAGKSDAARSIYAGSLLMASGIIWLLYNLGVICPEAFNVIFSWQMLLIAIGGFLISQRSWTAGGIVSCVGIVFLVCELCNVEVSFNKIILPVILISAGAAMLLSFRK